MPRLRIVNDEVDDHGSHDGSQNLRFPVESARSSDDASQSIASAEHVLDALENVSRRIDDLARELNCLGWFDDDDGPRAA